MLGRKARVPDNSRMPWVMSLIAIRAKLGRSNTDDKACINTKPAVAPIHVLERFDIRTRWANSRHQFSQANITSVTGRVAVFANMPKGRFCAAKRDGYLFPHSLLNNIH
jgi:hypothetical protein